MGLGIIAAVFLLITIVLLIAWAIARHYDGGVEFQIESFLTVSLIACGCITFIFGIVSLLIISAEEANKANKEWAEKYAQEVFDEGASDAEFGLPYSNRHSGEQRKQYRDGYLSKKK